MALYRFALSRRVRGTDAPAQAAAAYRAGERFTDATGRTHDYRRRRSAVMSRHLIGWTGTRADLWDAAEKAERRAVACVAREAILSLPHELTQPARERAALTFSRWLSDRLGVAVDLCIHRPGKHDPRNWHAHAMFTSRRVEGGALGAKTRELDEYQTGRPLVEEMRRTWGAILNHELAQAGEAIRLDHRSHRRQGSDREPANLPRAAAEVERRTGTPTPAGDRARGAKARNRTRTARARLTQAAGTAYPAPIEAPTRRRRRAVEAPSVAQEAAALPTPTGSPTQAPQAVSEAPSGPREARYITEGRARALAKIAAQQAAPTPPRPSRRR